MPPPATQHSSESLMNGFASAVSTRDLKRNMRSGNAASRRISSGGLQIPQGLRPEA